MKAAEVMRILDISRVTLWTYVKKEYIKVNKLPNGYYDYDEKSVFEFKNSTKKQTIIYARVSTYKQKNDLLRQIESIKKYCNTNSIKYDNIYSEISSGIDLDRQQFNLLLNDIFKYKVERVIITNKDRLTRLSFITLQNIFKQFGTSIVVINDKPNSNNYEELFNELISLMHYFSTKEYSKRKNKKQ